ncbi:MAG: anti-sigma factor family protein [Terriglobia bacterium]
MTTHLREQDYIPYLDGKLSAAERDSFDAHLAACADCRVRVEEMRALAGVLDQWTAVEPSPAFDAAVRTRLADEKEKTQVGFVWRPAFALGALAALALLAVLVGLWQTPTPPEGPQVTQTSPPEAGAPTQVESLPELTTATAGDELAVLEDAVLLENYELLQEFDVLFEGPTPEGEESL